MAFKDITRLKEIWKKTGRRKRLVDICIISYKEEGYIEHTLDKMMNQTLWKEGLMNIVVGEYSNNPKHLQGQKTSYLKELCRKNKFLHTYVPKRGVGFARNWTIMNGSISDIVCNFDADSRFNRNDAMELLTMPIFKKQAELTYCATVILNDPNVSRHTTLSEKAVRYLQDIAPHFEKLGPIGRAQGLTLTRRSFFRVNGLPISEIVEDYPFHWRFSVIYGMFSRKFIDEVKVLSSDRRIRAVSKYGIGGAMDYFKRDFR